MPRVSEATKAEHRQRLLEAAAAEFAAKGLEGARVDDISLAAGLAKGTIYNYFDSKQHTFRAVIEAWAQRTAEARSSTPPMASTRERLLAIARADMQVTGEMEEFARTAFREVLNGPSDLIAEVLPTWDAVDAVLVDILRSGQESGELRSDRSPQELSWLFTTMINGLLFEHWLPHSSIALDDIPDIAVEFYLHGASSK